MQYALAFVCLFPLSAGLGWLAVSILVMAAYLPALQWRDRRVFWTVCCLMSAEILVRPLVETGRLPLGPSLGAGVPTLLVLGIWGAASYRDLHSRAGRTTALYEDLFESHSGAIYQLSRDRTIEEVNGGFLELVALPREGVIGRSILEFVHREDHELLQGFRSQLDGGDCPDIEVRFQRTGGEERIVSWAEQPLRAGGEVIGFQGVIHDLTEYRQAQLTIRESEERYYTLFSSMREGVALHKLVFDQSGRAIDYIFLDVNPAFEEIVGFPAHRLLGRRASKVFGVAIPPYLEAYAEIVREGKPLRFEATFEPLAKIFSISAFGLSRERFATVLEDETDTRRLEEKLRHVQRMEAIGQLAGGVAHDFNNLLQAIVGHTDLAMSTLDGSHPACQDLDQVQRASTRAVSLTRQLLAFSRQQALEPSAVNLNEVVEDLAKMMRRLIGETVALELSLSRKPITIFADRGMVEQLLMNLCVNARDAMSGSGTIRIETRLGDARWEGSSGAAGFSAVLRVTDTGCGIPSELHERIFEPFFTTKTHGTGLGLATVFGIVRQHQGSVSVESEVGVGTTFEIRLRLASISAKSAPSAEAPSIPGGTETLLFAEDEPSLRELTLRILQKQGYTVYTASDGLDAIRVFHERAEEIDMVILDMVMPGLNGTEVLHRIRREKPQLPALFCTGYGLEALGEGAARIPDGGLIAKPYSAAALHERVRRILDEAAAKRRSRGRPSKGGFASAS